MNTQTEFAQVTDILTQIEDIVAFDQLASLYDTYYIDFENEKIYNEDAEEWTNVANLADALYYLLRDDFKNDFINKQLNYTYEELLEELKELS